MAIFISKLKENGFLDDVSIVIAQIGSRKLSINDDYGSQDWHFFAPNLTIYGFDADVDACDAANADLARRNIDWQEFHVPLILSNDCSEKNIYVTKHPMCSSLYEPNQVFLDRFSGMLELSGLSYVVEVETTTLDNFCQAESIRNIDFIQIDVQGAELDIFMGASQLLSRSGLVIQTEVEFSHLYKQQPLFSDVDSYLRSMGFNLFDLRLARWNRSVLGRDFSIGNMQILWGDAFYFRDLISYQYSGKLVRSPLSIFKLACIADVLNFSDYALELFIHIIQDMTAPQFNCAECLIRSLEEHAATKQYDPQQLPAINILKNYI